MGHWGRVVGLTAQQAIHGLGGVGKTRLAIECAWRHASGYENALFFVSAGSPADFRSNLAALCNAEILNLPERDKPEEKARLAAVFRWLVEHSGWLLILDSADTGAENHRVVCSNFFLSASAFALSASSSSCVRNRMSGNTISSDLGNPRTVGPIRATKLSSGVPPESRRRSPIYRPGERKCSGLSSPTRHRVP